jgi:hypothetical protein
LTSDSNVCICVSSQPTALERYAADELARYLQTLFGVRARITAEPDPRAAFRFVLGLSSDPRVKQFAKTRLDLSDQAHLVRRVASDTMLLAGGSPAAVAWSVYELVEHYGVRYLLHEDVLPQQPGPFYLPDVDVTCEPVQRLRSWRLINDLPTGPGLWSLAQVRAFITQIFKLKFNGILFHFFSHHPYIDYEVRGIAKQTACLLFGQKIPIDRDNIGRDHLVNAPYLTNPEYVGIEDGPDLLAAGKRMLQTVIGEARRFGMYTTVSIEPFDFPLEFRPLLDKPSGAMTLGGLTTSEMGDLTNANHVALAYAKIEAYLTTWGEVDEIILALPENAAADRVFSQCWGELAAKYRLEPDFNMGRLLAAAGRDHLVVDGPVRAERILKSTISMLHFLDTFFSRNDLLARAAAQCVKVGVMIQTPTIPFLDRVLWPDASLLILMCYTASRSVHRLHDMENIDASKVPTSLILTLQDDNRGSLPMVSTENNHILLQAMHRLGWRGYHTRYWPIGDLDPAATHLARASWDTSVTPRQAYDDHFERVYGEASVEPFAQVMRMLEDATVLLDVDFHVLFWPRQGTMDKFIESDKPMAEGLFHIRATYEQAHRMLERLRELPGPPARHGNLAYWISRLVFSIHAFREAELLSDGGTAVHAAIAAGQSNDSATASRQITRARDCYDQAIREGEAATRAIASELRDDSERSTRAAYYHYFVREVKQGTEAFLQSAESVFLTAWQVSGPHEGRQVKDAATTPDVRSADLQWHPPFSRDLFLVMPRDVKAEDLKPGMFYFRICLAASKVMDVVLSFGSDSAYRIWLNGREVACDLTAVAPCDPDEYQHPVSLCADRNEIVIAYDGRNSMDIDACGICARMISPQSGDDNLLDTLRVAAEDEMQRC